MSYMNDDCDPFGIPYKSYYVEPENNNESFGICLKEEEEVEIRTDYTWEDLITMDREVNKAKKEYENNKKNKKEIKKSLTIQLNKLLLDSSKVEFDKDCNPTIITKKVTLSELEELKRVLDVREVIIKYNNFNIEITFTK